MGETLDQLHRVLTRPSMTPIERCAWNEHEIEDGACVTCAAPRCDCGRALPADDTCSVCDVCHCSSVDRETGYTECRVHETDANDRPAGDVMTALKSAMGMGK